jgi:hypothetical protein
MEQEKQLTEQESLLLINQMINKAKNAYHGHGTGPLMWGIVIFICSMTSFLEMHFKFSLPFDIWLLTFVAIIPQVIISIREKRKKSFKSYDEATFDFVWLTFAICVLLLSAYQAFVKPPDSAASLYLMLYAMPTFITGGIMKFKPMLLGGIITWVLVIISFYTGNEIDILLIALSALLCWLIPGLILQSRAKAKRQHV